VIKSSLRQRSIIDDVDHVFICTSAPCFSTVGARSVGNCGRSLRAVARLRCIPPSKLVLSSSVSRERDIDNWQKPMAALSSRLASVFRFLVLPVHTMSTKQVLGWAWKPETELLERAAGDHARGLNRLMSCYSWAKKPALVVQPTHSRREHPRDGRTTICQRDRIGPMGSTLTQATELTPDLDLKAS
jgi:hypothetical protein